jgi:hypothetical protein
MTDCESIVFCFMFCRGMRSRKTRCLCITGCHSLQASVHQVEDWKRTSCRRMCSALLQAWSKAAVQTGGSSTSRGGLCHNGGGCHESGFWANKSRPGLGAADFTKVSTSGGAVKRHINTVPNRGQETSTSSGLSKPPPAFRYESEYIG